MAVNDVKGQWEEKQGDKVSGYERVESRAENEMSWIQSFMSSVIASIVSLRKLE
jgi:hypothetical protein